MFGQTIMSDLETVVQGNGDFSKNLFAILSKKPGNVFFSPISIHTILSLVYQGAQGSTHEALAKALNVPDSRVAAAGYEEVLPGLKYASRVTFRMANKVCLRETYKLQTAFKAVAVQKFLSKVKQLNFEHPKEAASSINTWVGKKTKKKITEIVDLDDITERTALILVNAIYFKGKWAHPFKKRNTHPGQFYVNEVDTIEVPMMHIEDKFFYNDDADLDAQVLELPYANKKISLIVVLPKDINGIAEMEKKLATVDITKLTENMQEQEVTVWLPKFKIEQTIDLEDPLTELGLGVIFSDSAQFPGIIGYSQSCYVSKIVQKTFFEMHEEDLEASAATGMYMQCCGRITENFCANHPFVVILQAEEENVTNVLFKGRIFKPEY